MRRHGLATDRDVPASRACPNTGNPIRVVGKVAESAASRGGRRGFGPPRDQSAARGSAASASAKATRVSAATASAQVKSVPPAATAIDWSVGFSLLMYRLAPEARAAVARTAHILARTAARAASRRPPWRRPRSSSSQVRNPALERKSIRTVSALTKSVKRRVRMAAALR